MEAFYFGTEPQDGPQIAPLVLSGQNSATGSVLWSYEADEKPVPKAGDHYVVTTGADDPVCVIEAFDVQILPFE